MCGHAAQGDVFAAADHLDLGQLQELVLARQLDAHEARRRPWRGHRRLKRHAHAGHHEIPRGMAGTAARERRAGHRFQPQRGKRARLAERHADFVRVLCRAGSDVDHTVVRDDGRLAGLRAHRVRNGHVPRRRHRKSGRPLLRGRLHSRRRMAESRFHLGQRRLQPLPLVLLPAGEK